MTRLVERHHYKERSPVELPQAGHGDWLYSRDAAAGVVALLTADRPRHRVYNVGNGEEITIMALAEKIKAMTDSKSDIRCVPYDIAYGKGFEDMEFRTPDMLLKHLASGTFAPLHYSAN